MRIALDPRELAEHPLQIGLSMQADVDTHQRDGNRLPQLVQATPSYTTDMYDSVAAATAERVSGIIAANDRDGARAVSGSAATSVAHSSVPALDGGTTVRRVANGRAL